MVKGKFAYEDSQALYPIDIEIDDDSMLADGLIADSRIIGLIDELDSDGGDESYVEDEDPGLTLQSLGMLYDGEE